MIFSIRDLGFELGPFLLEGWLALAARCVCALAIFLAGSLVSLLLRKKICPALRGRGSACLSLCLCQAWGPASFWFFIC